MFHNSQAVLALSLTPNDTMFQKTLALNDFYFGMDGFPYPMGNIQMIGKTLGGMYRAEKPLLTALMPDRALDEIARHSVDFWLTTEDLPDPDNRVTIDRDGRLTLHYTPNNQVPKQKLYEKLRSMLTEIGLQSQHMTTRDLYMRNDIALAGCAHQAGTCRFGDDPATSVLDRDCKAHELDNLYVVDTSFFVSIGAVNPSLTAIANALRVGDHLLRAWADRVAQSASRFEIALALSRRRGAGPGAGHLSGRQHDLHQPHQVSRLSSTQYGAMFIPQVVLAILASAFGSRLARRLELRGVLRLGLCGDLLAMALLAASPLLIGTQAAFVMLCVATGALGLGFGATVMALNTLVEGFFPKSRGRRGAAVERVARRRYGAGAAAGGAVHRAGHRGGDCRC